MKTHLTGPYQEILNKVVQKVQQTRFDWNLLFWCYAENLQTETCQI